jgi:hypothetical protein
MDELGLRLLPILAPAVRVARKVGPFHCRGDVAYGCVEPYVEALVLKTGLGDRHAPFDVACYGPLLQATLYHAQHEVSHRVAPVVLRGHPRPQAIGEFREVEVEVRGLAYLYGSTGDLGVRVYELVGFVPASAVVALVAASLLVTAHGTGPLDVAVR